MINISQHNKDEENEKLKIRDFFNQKNNGICVEVGSNEPTSFCSQSFHLEKKLNWKCILVEPNPFLANKAKKLRPNAIVCEIACASTKCKEKVNLFIPLDENSNEVTGHASLEKNIDEHNYALHNVIDVETDTLSNILKPYDVSDIDLLSIVVEGFEMEVLLGFDFSKYRPKLILLEDKHLYLKKHIFLKKNGYKLVQRLNRNCWYIPDELDFPKVSITGKLKLFKRMYISIWYKKILYSLKHKSLKSFKSL